MADDGGVVDIFVYLGGQQFVPDDVTHVRIDRSVKIIPARAFVGNKNLVSVETHDGLEKIERDAFVGCHSLRRIKLPGVVKVGDMAFLNCRALTDVEFGNKLETVGGFAFDSCTSLRSITMPSVRIVEQGAFYDCEQLTDVELPAVETIEAGAFAGCENLHRIAIPLKDNMFPLASYLQRCTHFGHCENLRTIDLVGVEGIHKTISSFLLESWRDEILQEINSINRILPNTRSSRKTGAIQRWVRSILSRIEHYKVEHYKLLKEDMTQLELALWKAKLDEKEYDSLEGRGKIDTEDTRKEKRITSGASIVIRNVLPFLQLG